MIEHCSSVPNLKFVAVFAEVSFEEPKGDAAIWTEHNRHEIASLRSQ